MVNDYFWSQVLGNVGLSLEVETARSGVMKVRKREMKIHIPTFLFLDKKVKEASTCLAAAYITVGVVDKNSSSLF